MPLSNPHSAGSESELSEPRLLIIGRITRPHGVRGELRVQVRTSQPERFGWLEQVLVGDQHIPMVVENARFHQKFVILKLAGCDDRNQAETLRNQLLQVREEDAIPLEEDEIFLYQLIGLQVRTVDGVVLGELVDVLETGANDVFVVRPEQGKELLLPDIPQVILEINPEAGHVLVQLPPGLLD